MKAVPIKINEEGRNNVYRIDITDISTNGLRNSIKTNFLLSKCIYYIYGTLNKDINLFSVDSSFIFHELKLNGGTLTLDAPAKNIRLSRIENINDEKISTLNLLSYNDVIIEENDLDSNCLVNITSYPTKDVYTFNLNNQKRQTPEKSLVQTLSTIKNNELERIIEDLDKEWDISFQKRIRCQIGKK